MKGISTILAMILIVIIVVALIGLTYTFAIGLFQTTTEGASSTTTDITERMQKSAVISSATCDASDNIDFTIRATGSGDIDAAEIYAFIDEKPLNLGSTAVDVASGTISSEMTGTGVTLTAGVHTLKVSVPAGESPSYSVTCP